MNKILLIDDNIKEINLDNSITYELIPKNILFEVNTLIININSNTELNIFYQNINDSKLNIEINILDNIICTLNEFREGTNSKVKYHYNISSNSTLNLYKFYDIDNMKEFVKIDLNEIGASINYHFRTICKNTEKYDLTIYHNKPKTNSNIINNGVNINDGNLTFNVSSFVESGNVDCNVIQKSRIINKTNNKCQICPNLYIDEYNVQASHSAHIGTFKDDELFYLMSRGINEAEASYLLIKGFLLNNMNKLTDKIEEICEKYWR